VPAPTFEATSRIVRTPGWQIHYNQWGEGPPLVLMHGSGAGASGWVNFRHNIEALGKHFTVYAVDQPGWGGSEAVTVDRLRHVEPHIEFLDALGIDQAAFIGNSMGGITGLGIATRFPERMTHLITMGSGSSRAPKLFSPGDGLSEGLKILFKCYFEPTLENMRDLCDVMMFDAGEALDSLGLERFESAHNNTEHLTNMIAGLPQGAPVPQWFSIDDLPKVQIPTLLIHGRDDRVVPYEHSLLLLSYIPNSRLVLLNRCGHWAMIEHPEEFNRLVIDFITNN